MTMQFNANWNRNYLDLPISSSPPLPPARVLQYGRKIGKERLYFSYEGKTVISLIPKLTKNLKLHRKFINKPFYSPIPPMEPETNLLNYETKI